MNSASYNRKSRPKISPLDQKMRPNKKYAGIKASVDTGYNLRKQMERMEELRHFYKFKPDEIFRRVNITTLVTLMIEVSKLEIQESDLSSGKLLSNDDADSAIDNEDEDNAAEFVLNGSSDRGTVKRTFDSEFADSQSIMGSVYSGRRRFYSGGIGSFRSNSVADLVQGIGEMDCYDRLDSVSVINAENGNESFESRRPFILLDVRGQEEFEQAHIVGAESYPQSRLSRSINFESRSMLKFKNRPGKLIVVYDFDESLAAKSATTLIQRGYDNVFMLSGGMRVAKIKFPERLCIKSEANSKRATSLSEDDILVLEERLEEAMRKASTRLSEYASTVCSSRIGMSRRQMSASQPTLQVKQLDAAFQKQLRK